MALVFRRVTCDCVLAKVLHFGPPSTEDLQPLAPLPCKLPDKGGRKGRKVMNTRLGSRWLLAAVYSRRLLV